MNSSNCDLFRELFEQIKTKELRLKVRWMPSHLGKGEDDPRPSNVSHFDVMSNDQADEYASKAAEEVQLPKPVAVNHIYYVNLVGKIQRRLATILLNLPTRLKNKEPKKEVAPRVKLDYLFEHTSHDLVHLAQRVRCTKCLNSFSLNDPACKVWLRLACTPASTSRSSSFRVFPIQLAEPIHIGNQISHMSHKLCSYRGFLYCANCGCRAGGNQIRNLARRCEPPSSTGEHTLSCISDGQLPPGLLEWPENTA